MCVCIYVYIYTYEYVCEIDFYKCNSTISLRSRDGKMLV